LRHISSDVPPSAQPKSATRSELPSSAGCMRSRRPGDRGRAALIVTGPGVELE
jgi:hypothetical protein